MVSFKHYIHYINILKCIQNVQVRERCQSILKWIMFPNHLFQTLKYFHLVYFRTVDLYHFLKSHNNEMKTTWPNFYMWVQIYSYCMAYGLNVLLECLLNYLLSIQWCLEITFPENQLAWGKNNWNQITSCFGNLDEDWNHQHIARNSLTPSSEQKRD